MSLKHVTLLSSPSPPDAARICRYSELKGQIPPKKSNREERAAVTSCTSFPQNGRRSSVFGRGKFDLP